jgi:hypothetical protein
MSYFVTITFDIKDAANSPHGTNVYSKITGDLKNLEYDKFVSGKKKNETGLPSNTYVAVFEDDGDHQTEIVEYVKTELKKVFKKYSVKGKYFISVGKGWSWKIGRFQ